MLFIAFFLTTASAIAQSATSTDKRTVAPYHNLEIEGAFTVTLVQGDEEAVYIDATTELTEEVMIKADDGTLKIYTKKDSKTSGKVALTIYFKNLKSIDCSGAILLTGTLSLDELSLDLSGACKATMEIHTASLHVDISGSGNAAFSGKVSDVGLDISGAGKFMAAGLMADDYEIDISGTGNAEVNAAKTLDVDVSGAGIIKYSGDPKISREISGAGIIAKL